MSDDIFDFGFTVVDEHELEAVHQAQEIADAQATTVGELQDKLDRLYKAVLPLLKNLKANPEKDYIYWPGRVGKVEEFEKFIASIMED